MTSAMRRLKRLKRQEVDFTEMNRVYSVLDTKAQADFSGRHMHQLNPNEAMGVVGAIDAADQKVLEEQAGALYASMQPEKTPAAKAFEVGAYVLAVIAAYMAIAGSQDLRNIHPDWGKYQVFGRHRQLDLTGDRAQVMIRSENVKVYGRNLPLQGDANDVDWEGPIRKNGPFEYVMEYGRETNPNDPNQGILVPVGTWVQGDLLQRVNDGQYTPGKAPITTTTPGSRERIIGPGGHYFELNMPKEGHKAPKGQTSLPRTQHK